MASSHKTPHIGLNRWAGGDKPKRDDFNEDNRLTDQAIGQLQQAVQALEQGEGGGADHGGQDALAQLLAEHQADGASHILSGERQLWSGAAPILGYYNGDGHIMRRIDMGFTPEFGVLFARGKRTSVVDFYGRMNPVYAGFFSRLGSVEGIAVERDGITVTLSGNGPDGSSLRFNQADHQYIYFVWKAPEAQ